MLGRDLDPPRPVQACRICAELVTEAATVDWWYLLLRILVKSIPQ